MGEFTRSHFYKLIAPFGLLCIIAPTAFGAEPHGEEIGRETIAADDFEKGGVLDQFSMNYYGVFYGPSIQDPSTFQPNSSGVIDHTLPLLVRNYMSLSYSVSKVIAVSATAPWVWKPVQNQELQAKDPYFRLADNELFSTDQFNLYGDARFHAPVTTESRNSDLLAGLQTFFIASYQVPGSRLTWASYFSARYNIFGSQGTGSDTVLYAGPNLAYQLTPSVSLTTLYEMGASHVYKDKIFALNNDGTDLEPGIKWDINKSVSVNPYLNFFTGNKVSLTSTSIGMTMSWQLL